jgi:cob(I)alamin adenosyltransferase
MKIYTKTGDAGQTGLFSGTRIAKYDLRLHAYGTLDELNSHLGLLRDQIPAEWDAVRAELAQVQSDLFALGSHMANDLPEMVARLPHIDPAWIARLEVPSTAWTSTLSRCATFCFRADTCS